LDIEIAFFPFAQEVYMAKETVGVVYILTNPSFPEYVKIGYADDVQKRIDSLNHSEAVPFAFRLYAYYKVNTRLSDMRLHDMIDKLNPNLRSVDTINGHKRKREFYAMTPEEAYEILEVIAQMNSLECNLIKVKPTDEVLHDQKEAEEIRKRAKPLKKPTFHVLLNWGVLHVGDVLCFCGHEEESATLINDQGVVDFGGKQMKYTQWGSIVLAAQSFNFYARCHIKDHEKTLSQERAGYMDSHGIPTDKDFLAK
jgi:hypothetical protein